MTPAETALVVAIVAGVFGAGGGLFGAWLTARREHVRWLRERRLEAYRTFLECGTQVVEARTTPDIERSRAAMSLAQASVVLLGPKDIFDAVEGMVIAAMQMQESKYVYFRIQFLQHARAVLGAFN